MRFCFIEQHVGTFPVRLMCRVLEVSPSGFYAWRARPESARALGDQQLLADVRRLQSQHQGRYGSPRMHAALRAEGRGCSRGRVERLMRRHGIRALAGRRFRPCTTDSRHFLPVAPNLLMQRFIASAPGRIWLADITYIPTGDGWLYLAAILDLATRKIVGWSMRDHMRLELTARGIVDGRATAATGTGLGSPLRSRVAICRGRLYRSARRDRCRRFDEPDGVLLRQRAHGELLPHAQSGTRRQRRWTTHDEARRDLFAYLEGYYNRQRSHSAIGYLTPEQAERRAAA